MSFSHCNYCGQPWHGHGTACSHQFHSLVPARMPDQVNAEPEAEVRSVPPTGERMEVPCPICLGCGVIWCFAPSFACGNCKGTGIAEKTASRLET